MLVTFRARNGVEQWAESRLGCELTLEHRLALAELCLLAGRKLRKRLSKIWLFHRFATTDDKAANQHTDNTRGFRISLETSPSTICTSFHNCLHQLLEQERCSTRCRVKLNVTALI